MRNLARAAIVALSVSLPALMYGQQAGSLLVLSKHDHTLAIVDPGSLKVTARVPVGDDPQTAVKDFLVAQENNAIQSAAQKIPGSVAIPLSARQQLSQRAGTLPRYNEILIELEKARVQDERSFAERSVVISVPANAMTKSDIERATDQTF